MSVLEHDQRAGARLATLIAAVPEDRWAAPTPCSEWTVRDLVRHLIAGNVKYAEIARGGEYTPGVPQVAIGDDPAGRYRQTLSDMLQAWRAPKAFDREITLPGGQRGRADVAAWIHLAETLGHGWDLAIATHQDPGFDDDVVIVSLEECRRRMPAHRSQGSPFADAVNGAGRSPMQQFAAYLGRTVQPAI